MSPSVSLIIALFNRADYIQKAIASIQSQTYPDFNLLVWDDGSTDGSLDIALSLAHLDSRIRVFPGHHQGVASSLKAAIASTSGKYLGWVDSDDLLAPTALEETVAILETHPTAGCVYTDHDVIDEQGHHRGLGKRCRMPYSPKRMLVDFMTFHFRLIRRSVYDQVGGIDASFERAEDYDLCLRLSEVTTFYHLQRPLYFYRQHRGNMTRNQTEQTRWSYQAVNTALRRRGLSSSFEITLQGKQFHFHPRSTPQPLVSIIIPCYNSQATLSTCLKSCFQQSYPHLEVIVVDNNSTDESVNTVAACAQTAPFPLRLYRCHEQGANSARNQGFMQAQGDYIQWLDADDELHPDKITQQVEALETHRDFDVAYGDWLWCFYRGDQLTTQLSFVGKQHPDALLQALMDNWRPPHAYLLRRSAANALHKLRAWNPSTPACMDREYFTLAALTGLSFLYVPGSTVRYKGWSSSQISRSTPYQVRVQSLRQMFARFQSLAAQRSDHPLHPAHLFLLGQSWDLWQPAFSLLTADDASLWLKHTCTGNTQIISPDEVRILQALLQAPRPFTLEDHARHVIRCLWQETVLALYHSRGLDAVFDHATVSSLLAQAIGLPVTAPALSFTEPSKRSLPLSDSQATLDPMFNKLLRAFPLYTPLFAEYRLKVLGVLERLRLQGWLQQVTPDAVIFKTSDLPHSALR